MCCRVNTCCFCFEHVLGVKVLGVLCIFAEITIIVLSTLFLPQYLFAIGPFCSIGIFCDIFLLVAAFRSSRWLLLPWLIYVMIAIVGLGLAAVLRIVIPLGAFREPDWLIIILNSVLLLAVASLLLYFWVVVLELFIRLGPVGYDPAMMYGTNPYGMYPTVPMQQYAHPYNQNMGPPPAAVYFQAGPPPMSSLPPLPPPNPHHGAGYR